VTRTALAVRLLITLRVCAAPMGIPVISTTPMPIR
jgi:hypothetical protein